VLDITSKVKIKGNI